MTEEPQGDQFVEIHHPELEKSNTEVTFAAFKENFEGTGWKLGHKDETKTVPTARPQAPTASA